MAAAAAIQTMKRHRILTNPLHRSHSNEKKKHGDKHIDQAECQREKDFICQYKDCDHILSPDQLDTDPRNQNLGISSKQLRIGDFELIKTLGTGTFARVWLARVQNPQNADKDKVFALKILKKVDIIRLKQVEHVKNERATLSTVAGHPFITTLITTFADHDHLYMLLDYCPGGEIFTYLRRVHKFNETIARFYAAEIVLVLEYLHDHKGIAYRDLKPENILLDAQGHLKLVDFGFAKKIGKCTPSQSPASENGPLPSATETYTLCGTPEYLAPEVIKNSGHGTAVDWWAFGILLYEFLVGQPPFWDSNPMKIYSKIVDGKISFPNSIPPAARSLIEQVCTVNPSERLGNVAGGSQKIKDHEFFKDINWDDLYYRRVQGPIVPKVKHAADASCFDNYDAAPERTSGNVYTKDMEGKHEAAFKDF